MESQVLHTVWCNISGEAEGEIRHWSLLGMTRFNRIGSVSLFSCQELSVSVLFSLLNRLCSSSFRSQNFYFPERAGYPHGDNVGPRFVVMETHYDNPEKKSGAWLSQIAIKPRFAARQWTIFFLHCLRLCQWRKSELPWRYQYVNR